MATEDGHPNGMPEMGRPTGLEPATPRFTILCSNQLSYDRRKKWNAKSRQPLRPCQSLPVAILLSRAKPKLLCCAALISRKTSRMLFWLKKAVSYWLMPLPFCLAVMLAGAILLRTAAPRRRRIGWNLFVVGAALLLFFSNPFVSQRLARSLESRYAPVPELVSGLVPPALARCRYVVVLGGGHADNPSLPAASQLSSYSLARITEGVRLLRALPEARLIVTGPGQEGRPTHASLLARTAVGLGIDPGRITRIEQARDTEEESQAVRTLVGDAPVALVSSAWHLPRAVVLFRQARVDVLPCPADFLVKNSIEWSWGGFLWDSASLECSRYVVHERLGLLWLWLRGKS
jgi:uncharacterized SAM-binding protein YcdF (DUF218 family)